MERQLVTLCLLCSVSTGLADANAQFAFGGPVAQTNGRRQLYGGVLSRLRLLMISRMAKPEEVDPKEENFGQEVALGVPGADLPITASSVSVINSRHDSADGPTGHRPGNKPGFATNEGDVAWSTVQYTHVRLKSSHPRCRIPRRSQRLQRDRASVSRTRRRQHYSKVTIAGFQQRL